MCVYCSSVVHTFQSWLRSYERVHTTFQVARFSLCVFFTSLISIKLQREMQHNLFLECKQETKPKKKKKMKKTPRPDESFEMISSFVISELRVCAAMYVPNHVVYTWNVHSIFITTCLSVHLNFYKYSTTTQILSLVYCFLLPFSLWDRNRWKKNKSQDFRRRQRRLNASQLISLQTKHFRSFIAIAIIRFDYWSFIKESLDFDLRVSINL